MLSFSRFEARTILKLSGPIVLAQLTQSLIYFVDTVMAGRVSATDMAAIAVASGLWMPIILTMQGLLLALTPIIAQYYGSKQTRPITHFVVQGMYLAFFVASILFGLMFFIDIPINYLNMEPVLRDKTLQYLNFVSWGIFPAAGYMVMRNLFEGLGYTKASMWIGFIGILVNVPFNYIFIYGKLGMPALGGAGCGLATTILYIAMFLAMLLYAWFSDITKSYRQRPASFAINIKDIWQIICLGTPIALSIFFEVTLFACIPLVIVHLGPIVVAGHQVAHNYSAIVFMIPLSLGLATTIRVGHLVGSRDISELKKAISTAIMLAVIVACTTALFTLTMRYQVASLYSTDNSVITLAASLLILAALYQISDAIQVISASALRGIKVTKPIFVITFIAYWPIGFGIGYMLGLTNYIVPAMGIYGFWIGIIIGLTTAAIMLAFVLNFHLRRLLYKHHAVPKTSV